MLANDTHVFSAGIGVNLIEVQDTLKVMKGPIRFDVHAQYFWLTEGQAWKTNPVEESFGDTTRWLALSATTIVPFASTATPRGSLNGPELPSLGAANVAWSGSRLNPNGKSRLK